MKISLPTITLLIYSILITCNSSDKLTKEKAESIIKNCQKTESLIKTRKFDYGIVQIDDLLKSKFPDFMKPYEKFEELGIVKIGPKQRVKGILGKKDQYEITLNTKGKELLINSKEGYKGKIEGKFKLCEYKMNNVQEIHEIPEKNIAKVKVKFIRYNETPFLEESFKKRNPKEILKTVTFRKTNEGWKLCN